MHVREMQARWLLVTDARALVRVSDLAFDETFK